MSKRLKAHLVKQKRVTEEMDRSLFTNVNESNLDPDNFVINNVCLFGRRESANGRIYSDTAIDSIVRLSNGGKCFINHITQQEMKDRHGVRDLRDWVGVFESSRRDGEKVLSNLKIREAYWDLVKDIAMLNPSGVGHSIDARIKVFQDDKTGKESVVDVVDLRSTDLVASAATTQNLFESAIQENQNNGDEQSILQEMAEYMIAQRIDSMNIEEGLLRNQQLKREIRQFTWDAIDSMHNVMWDKEKSIGDKKKAVINILDDLEKEINSRLSKIKKEGIEMDKDQLAQLREEIRQEMKEEEEFKNVQNENTNLKKQVTEANKKVTELEEELNAAKESNTKLTTENEKMAKELDEVKALEAIAKKKATVESIIAEAKLPKVLKSDLFVEDLMALEEKKDGDKVITFESQVKERVEERKKLGSKNGTVINNGKEFDDTQEELDEENGNRNKKDTKEALEDFTLKINRR